ncbi:MAG TPA: hypothetical protein DCS42_02485 [Nitrospiraceae bacterium]|jgi:hypothetical protein|nr:MAG: hypothetical protein A2072_04315 [Nitrospirae bacterium GWC1_57_7]OGW41788.1 MAG: hypothetical protein A2X57_09025 [Nitrospirae bacterium GWD2_57_8]HAR46972.1 hypothetical protein [Nitrospiraceae bacterium]HAS53058.1 hypothetical protein [Nitrospiraceae bacterium]
MTLSPTTAGSGTRERSVNGGAQQHNDETDDGPGLRNRDEVKQAEIPDVVGIGGHPITSMVNEVKMGAESAIAASGMPMVRA